MRSTMMTERQLRAKLSRIIGVLGNEAQHASYQESKSTCDDAVLGDILVNGVASTTSKNWDKSKRYM